MESATLNTVLQKAAYLREQLLKALSTSIELKFSFTSLQEKFSKAVNKIANKPIELKFSLDSLRQKLDALLKEKPLEVNLKLDKLNNSIANLETVFTKGLKDKLKLEFKPLQKTLNETKKVYDNFSKRLSDRLDDIQTFFRNDLDNKLPAYNKFSIGNVAGKAFGVGATTVGSILGYMSFMQNLSSAQTLYNYAGQIIGVGNKVNKGLEYLSFSGVDMTPYNVAQALANPFSYINPINPETTASIYTAAQQYADTEYQFARVKTILPKEQWNANLNNIYALQSRLQYSVSTPEILALQYEVLSAGFTKAADSAKITEAALKLTKAGFADAAETARLLVTTMQAYNQTSDEATSTAAKLQGIVQQGITTVPELANVFGQLASVASQAGVAIEDVGAALAVLTQKGQPTSVASTSIQSLIIKTLNMAPEAEKALKRYSAAAGKAIQINPATVRQQGFSEVLKQIGEITEFDPEKLREIYPEVQAYRAAIALLADRGAKLSSIRQDIGQSSAAFLEDQFQISLGPQKEQFVQFINTSKALLEDLGREAVPILNDFVSSAQKVLNATKQMPAPVKLLLGYLIKANLALSATADMFSTIFGIVKGLVTTLSGGALLGLVFRHLGDPSLIVKKITESVNLGIGTTIRTAAQEAFGLDSTYSILLDKLIKKGYDRAQAERAISDALKDRQNTVQSLLKDEQTLIQYASKVKTSGKLSASTQRAVAEVFGEGISPQFYERMQNLYYTETRREGRVREKLSRVKQRKESIQTELKQKQEKASPTEVGRLVRQLEDLSGRERRLTQALPDARKKRYLRFGIDTVKLAEKRRLFIENEALLTKELATRLKIPEAQVTDTMRSQYLGQLTAALEQRTAFLRGERGNEIARVMGERIKESLREVSREIKQVTRERDIAIRANDSNRAAELQARRDELLRRRDQLKEDRAFYTSNANKELQKLAINRQDLGKTTIFTPEGLLSSAATLGSISYFLTNLPTLSNLNKASSADIANLVISGLFAGGTTMQFVKDYKDNLKSIAGAMFNPIQSGSPVLMGAVRGIGSFGNTLNRVTGVDKYLDMASAAVPVLQNNTVRGWVGLGGTALLAAAAGLTVGNAYTKFQEYKQGQDRLSTASTSVTEITTSWKNMQSKVIEMLDKNSSSVDENTKATIELTAEIRRILMPEGEQEVIKSTSKELEPKTGKARPISDNEFNKIITKLNKYQGEDLISATVGRATNRFLYGLDASIANATGIKPEDIQAALAAASKDPKKYQAFKATMMKIAAGWGDTQQYTARLVDYDTKLEELRQINPDNVFAFISPKDREKIKQKIARGEQLPPEVIDAVNQQRRAQAGKVEAFKSSLIEEASQIKKQLDDAVNRNDIPTAALLTTLYAEYKTKLQEFDELEKKFKGAKEFGQEQLEGYNQFARNVALKRDSQGNLTAMARQFAVQELMGFAEGRAKIQEQVNKGNPQGNFMQILKDNLTQEFESILQSVDEGVLSFEYALKKLKDVVNYEVSLNGKKVSPFSPREQLQLEQRLLEVQKKKIDLEAEYHSNLLRISEILKQIDLSKTIEYFRTLSDFLAVFTQKVGNTSDAIRSSVERLKGVTDAFAAAPLESASLYYDSFARQAKNFTEINKLDLEAAQEQSNYLKQKVDLDEQLIKSDTEYKKLDLELQQKYSRRDAEAKSIDQKIKDAQRITNPKKREKILKEAEEAKKNLDAFNTQITQDKAKLDLLKSQSEQLINQQAILENQYKVRKMMIEIQKESLKIEQQFIEEELKIERAIIEKKRVLGEAQWNRDTLINWIDKTKAGKADYIQAKMENTSVNFENQFLDKKYQIEQQVYDLMVKQYELAMKKQRVEMNIMKIKLQTEKIKTQQELTELKGKGLQDKKIKERYEVSKKLLEAIDIQLGAIDANAERLQEVERTMREGFEYQRSVMRQNYEDAKLQLALRQQISAIEASPQKAQTAKLGFLNDFISQLSSLIDSAKYAVSNRYSTVSSLVSQFYPAFSRDQTIKKQVMEARLELEQKQQEYKFTQLSLQLKGKELDIAQKLKEIELSTAEAKLRAEMSILAAKKEQAALNGASAEELKAYEEALSALREQQGLYAQQRSFMRSLFEIQRFGNQMEIENANITSQNDLRVAQAKHTRAVTAATSGVLAANKGFREDVTKIVADNLNSISKTDAIYNKLKALVDSIGNYGGLTANNSAPKIIPQVQLQPNIMRLSDSIIRNTEPQQTQPKAIQVGINPPTDPEMHNVLGKILTELVSFHKDFLAVSGRTRQSDALSQVTSALRQANTLR